MPKGGLLPILREINQFLMHNHTYSITEADYKMCIRVFGKINERYANAKTKSTKNISNINLKPKVAKSNRKKKKKSKLNNKEILGTGFQKKGIERDIDGSKGYHKIRENGRFGSHSMYDNMGDESMP